MSSCRELALALSLLVASAAGAQAGVYPGVGRPATAQEIAAWDIDVRPDFKGLPKGAGSVAKGMQVWEGKCASCHGIFGESNEVFAPIVGGTTQDDIRTGRVARLNDASFPGRTTLMKLSTVSTLWDYINRAMPWTQPKSLSIEEVYGVTAYILNLGGVLPDGFTLSDSNIAEVQKRLPNRHGSTTEHALWPGTGTGQRRPDVMASACMKDCAKEVKLASFLPDFARGAHGNLAEQNRAVGAQRGVDTGIRVPPATAAPATGPGGAAAIAVIQKHSCVACHGLENKGLGPSFREVSKKHAGRADAVDYMVGKIRSGGTGAWGAMAMPPQSLSEADARAIAQWLAEGMKN
jgi:cytochrome c551/c552